MNKTLCNKLVSMAKQDQVLRDELLKQGSLYEGYAKEMENLHISNAEQLADIIKQHGWPGESLVGEKGARAASLIAQHAISKPDLQKQFLIDMGKAVEQGEAAPVLQACLQDRILFNQGKPQLFGMLFDWDESGELVTNVDSVEKANQRRKQLGLRTLEEAIQLHRKYVEEEGGGPPKNIIEHKRMAEAGPNVWVGVTDLPR